MFPLIKLIFVFTLLNACLKEGAANQMLTVTDVTFLDVSIDNRYCGKIVIGLFGRIVPRTCKNFCDLCTGACGFGYKGSIFHRCIKDFMIQGGDWQLGNGLGGTSTYRDRSGEYGKFADENYYIRHCGAGWLSMANSGPNTNGAQFFITLQNCGFLDNKHVVFGKVLKGMSVVRTIEKEGVDQNNKPVNEIKIQQCGRMSCTPFQVKVEPVPDNV